MSFRREMTALLIRMTGRTAFWPAAFIPKISGETPRAERGTGSKP